MIGVDIYGILSESETVSGIIGTRIYPNDASAKETPLPCIIYELQNLVLETTYDEEGTIDLATIDFIVHCVARTYGKVQELYNAVMPVLVDYSGGRIEGIKHESSVEESIFNPNSDEAQYYKVEITFKVWFYWKRYDLSETNSE